ncbi:hypothetical protein L207DRAFT_638002 [Hyaloscypha variabilis F]|uniref:Clr5 domain-containing protein n=1 Tax=Hyaloscypha variabilis (strain UAMH 11265 / GT02V1 / F) TaxID=1149755 RepID=A0A2J6RAX6_HYAVF|nr:hypothetical protein L207DRAFT_638002 [Hyaloscypha variabilis F]
MEIFERDFGLKACTRTWRTKLKEWKFEKYLTDKEKIMGAVTTKKKGLETNGSVILHEKRSISPLRPASKKKRKNERVVEATLQNRATSQNLTHEPPLPAEKGDLVAEVHSHGSSNQLQTLKEPFQNNNKNPVNPVTFRSLSNGPYSASLRMFKTVTNDSKLFIAACSAGLVRILVRHLEKQLRQDLLEMQLEGISTPFLWWTRSTSGLDIAMTAHNSSKATGSYRTVLSVMTIRQLFVKPEVTV